jgi:ornithine--oxo-acid transaminase
MATASQYPETSTHNKHFEEQYSDGVNPHWVRLHKLLQMNVQYDHCLAAELFTTDGRVILDCLSGYCVHDLGHNHPAIIEAIKLELDRLGPSMQSHVPERAGELAKRLCQLAGGEIRKAFSCPAVRY